MLGQIGLALGFVLGVVAAGVALGTSGEFVVVDDYRALQVECGKAHYDSRTGEFLERKK